MASAGTDCPGTEEAGHEDNPHPIETMKWPMKLEGLRGGISHHFIPREIMKMPISLSEPDAEVEIEMSIEHYALRGMVNINKIEPWNGLVYEPCNANRTGWAFMVIDKDKKMAIAYYH